MPADKQLAIDSFMIEWQYRKLLMMLSRCGTEAIANHRAEILHRYGLTEEDVKNAEVSSNGDS